jgi:hypothetical protein
MATGFSGNLGGWSTKDTAKEKDTAKDKDPGHGPHCYKKTYASRCAHCGAEVRGWECEHGKKGFLDAGNEPGVEHVCAVVARRERFNPQDEPLSEAKCPDCGVKVKVRQRLGITWHLDHKTLRAHDCRTAKA